MRSLIAVCLVSACGRVGFETTTRGGDAGIAGDTLDDAAPAECASFSPWATPQNIAALNSPAIEWGPHLSHDQLTLYFASNRGGGNDDLYQAVRESPTSPWQAPTLIQLTAAIGLADDPGDTVDGLELFWGASSVRHATRATAQDVWVPQGNVAIPVAGFSVDGGPDLSADGLILFFTGTETADGLVHEYQTTRTSTSAAWQDAVPVPLAHAGQGESYGSLRGDLRELIYATENGGHLMIASRPSATAAFGPASALPDLDAVGSSSADPDLSDDGLTLWYAGYGGTGAGQWDLWFSTRTCL